MFAARGIAVSFSVFLIIYCAFSLAVICSWRKIWLHSRGLSAHRLANLLFVLRMLPFVAAAVVTAVFTVPSFLLLEPRVTDESLIGPPLVLAICGAAWGIFGVLNTVVAFRKAARTISAWTAAAQPVESCISFPVLRIARAVPAMTAAGIVRHRILISAAAEFALNQNELQTALDHEVAHVRRHDNLKKLLFRFVVFPGLRSLEVAWFEAAELAADDAAVSSASQALDLAAALVKLSRLGLAESPIDLSAALVQGGASTISARIERLIAWSERNERNNRDRAAAPQIFSGWFGVSAGLTAFALIVVIYSQLLVRLHTATEWLVR